MSNAVAKVAFTPSARGRQGRNGFDRLVNLLPDARSGGDIPSNHERALAKACDGSLRIAGNDAITRTDLPGNRRPISLRNLMANVRVALIATASIPAERLKTRGRDAAEFRDGMALPRTVIKRLRTRLDEIQARSG